jgi:SpoVK/Ycf46/Vps4 family AAA+-type ATPase
MGESIAKLRLIFEAMQDYRAVYLFDEFDSIGTNRSHLNDVGEIRRVLNSFLINIEKDESSSLIIAATNLPETLDKALHRRFDDIIQYPIPAENEIKEIINKNIKGFSKANELSLQALAKSAKGLNFADIVRACEEALKEMIIHDKDKVSEKTISQFLLSRKRNND